MKYILKFLLQTIVLAVFVFPVFIVYCVWNWEIPDTTIFKNYRKNSQRLMWRLSGKYQPTPKPTTY